MLAEGVDAVVLEYISGGELLDLVNEDRAHAMLGEGLLKRMWHELVDVVAWLHSKGVVHRDIKLESEPTHFYAGVHES